MPIKSGTIVPKSSASKFMLLFTLFRSQKYERHELNAFDLRLVINLYLPQ